MKKIVNYLEVGILVILAGVAVLGYYLHIREARAVEPRQLLNLENYPKVKVGMSTREVLNIMGSPEVVTRKYGWMTFYYSLPPKLVSDPQVFFRMINDTVTNSPIPPVVRK